MKSDSKAIITGGTDKRLCLSTLSFFLIVDEVEFADVAVEPFTINYWQGYIVDTNVSQCDAHCNNGVVKLLTSVMFR